MAYSRSTWVDNSAPAINAANLNNIEAGLEAADTIARAAIPKSTGTTAGDTMYFTASATVTRLALGTTGKVYQAGATAPAWQYPPGYEYSYVEKTSDTSITASTSATSDTVVTAAAFTGDATVVILLEFWCPYVIRGTTNINVQFFDGSTAIGGAIGITGLVQPLTLRKRLTPSAASHTYSVRAFVDAGTGTVKGGAGGAGVLDPCFIRVVRAA